MNRYVGEELRATGANLYGTFKNAFSFVLAVTTVDELVDSDQDLLVLALSLLVVIILVALVDSMLKTFRGSTVLLAGPTDMGLYVFDTTLTVLIHFLSTTLGRWSLRLKPGGMQIVDMIPMFIATMCLLWLLGRSIGVSTV